MAVIASILDRTADVECIVECAERHRDLVQRSAIGAALYHLLPLAGPAAVGSGFPDLIAVVMVERAGVEMIVEHTHLEYAVVCWVAETAFACWLPISRLRISRAHDERRSVAIESHSFARRRRI